MDLKITIIRDNGILLLKTQICLIQNPPFPNLRQILMLNNILLLTRKQLEIHYFHSLFRDQVDLGNLLFLLVVPFIFFPFFPEVILDFLLVEFAF